MSPLGSVSHRVHRSVRSEVVTVERTNSELRPNLRSLDRLPSYSRSQSAHRSSIVAPPDHIEPERPRSAGGCGQLIEHPLGLSFRAWDNFDIDNYVLLYL